MNEPVTVHDIVGALQRRQIACSIVSRYEVEAGNRSPRWIVLIGPGSSDCAAFPLPDGQWTPAGSPDDVAGRIAERDGVPV